MKPVFFLQNALKLTYSNVEFKNIHKGYVPDPHLGEWRGGGRDGGWDGEGAGLGRA